MRRLFKFLMGLVITALVFVGLIFGFLYTNEVPPTLNAATINIEDMLFDEVDNLIDETNDDKTLSVVISENDINYLIKEQLEKDFPPTGNDDYLFETGPFKVQGVWVKVKNETKLDIIAGMHLDMNFMTFKSRILIQLEVIATSDSDIVVTIKKVSLGRLPIRWLIKLAPNLAKSLVGFDIEELIDELLDGMGTFDAKKLSVTFNVANIFKEDGLEKEIVKLLKEQEIVNLGFQDDANNKGFNLSIDLNDLKSDKERRIVAQADKITTEQEFQDFMQNKILTSVLMGNNSLILSETDLDRVIDYMLKDMITNDLLIKQQIYEQYELMIGVPYFEFKVVDSKVNIPVLIGDNLNTFNSNLDITIEFTKQGDNLVLEVSDIIIGTLQINEEISDALLDMLQEGNDMFTEGKIVLVDFFKTFSEQNLDVSEINTLEGSLELKVDGFDFSNLVGEIIDELNIPELNDLLNDILDEMDQGNDPMDLIDDLEDLLDDLTEEQLEDLLDLIGDYI